MHGYEHLTPPSLPPSLPQVNNHEYKIKVTGPSTFQIPVNTHASPPYLRGGYLQLINHQPFLPPSLSLSLPPSVPPSLPQVNNHEYKIKVTGPSTFQIPVNTHTSPPYLRGGYLQQIKQPLTLPFLPLSLALTSCPASDFVLADFAKMERPLLLHLGTSSLPPSLPPSLALTSSPASDFVLAGFAKMERPLPLYFGTSSLPPFLPPPFTKKDGAERDIKMHLGLSQFLSHPPSLPPSLPPSPGFRALHTFMEKKQGALRVAGRMADAEAVHFSLTLPPSRPP